MNVAETPIARSPRSRSELRVAIVCAVLMLATAAGSRIAARHGWVDTAGIAGRAHLVILAAFIVLTGNSIPKRLAPLARRTLDEARTQAFMRFAGWTWVLAGIAFGIACIVLPPSASTAATFVIMPTAIALVVIRWTMLQASRRRAS